MAIHYVQEGFIPGVDVLDLALSQFVIQVMTILTVCGILSVMGQYIKQPSVIFAIIGGIILGPSCLGKYDPYTAAVIPSASLEHIKIIASFGLQVYLFVVGLELDLTEFKENSQNMAFVALSGLVLPFACGIALAVLLYNLYFDDEADKPKFTTFAVFIGTSMCVTALPVLARILKENKLMDTVPGSIALSAAVINDAIAWILLVVAICLATASDSSVAGWVFFSIIIFVGLLLTVVRVAFAYVVKYVEDYSECEPKTMNTLLTATIIGFLLAGWIVDQIGIDPIVGCFVFGVIVPRESALYHHCVTSLESFVVIILLPLYFAISGIKTDLTQIKDTDLPILILVIAVASVSKFVGAGGAARYIGCNWRDTTVIAVLMNTRGLVELIILNIGLTYNVLNVRVFSILVIMCLFTTFLTCPLLLLVYPENKRRYITKNPPPTDASDLAKDIEAVEAAPEDHIELPSTTSAGSEAHYQTVRRASHSDSHAHPPAHGHPHVHPDEQDEDPAYVDIVRVRRLTHADRRPSYQVPIDEHMIPHREDVVLATPPPKSAFAAQRAMEEHTLPTRRESIDYTDSPSMGLRKHRGESLGEAPV